MKVQFNVEYQTSFGEDLVLNILPAEQDGKLTQHKMTTLDGCHWFVEITKNPKPGTFIDYYYSLRRGDDELRHEWLVEPHRLEFAAQKGARYMVYDHWIDIPEDAYMYSSALTDCIMANQRELSTTTEYERTVRLKVRAPQIRIGEQLAIVGACDALGNWDVNKALPMFEHEYHEWVVSLDAAQLPQTFEFKFAMLGIEQPVWEEGANRTISLVDIAPGEVLVYELPQVYLPLYPWKGAGTVIPIFSLRSEGSFGVGDFGDLKKMVDWADKTNQRILQVLPINDTNMTGCWQDSYPYNAISIYALHPQYTDFRQLPTIKDGDITQGYASDMLKTMRDEVYPVAAKKVYSRAKDLFEREMYEEAITWLSAASDMDKENENPIYYIGRSYQALEKYQEALEYFRKTLEIAPNTTLKELVEERIEACEKELS